MYANLAKQSREERPLGAMSDVFDKFLLESLPALAERTRSDYRKYIERLRKSFGDAPPREVSAGDLFDFRAELAKASGVVQANRHNVVLLGGVPRRDRLEGRRRQSVSRA